jgi:hypothetical protein
MTILLLVFLCSSINSFRLLHHCLSFVAEQLPCAQPLPEGTQLLPPMAQLQLIFF